MRKLDLWLAALSMLPMMVAAQSPSVITMDQEPHHHLVLKNDVVKVFQVDLAPREAMLTYWHEHDDVSIVVGNAATVSTTPGQPDILRISKPGEINLVPGPGRHSVRNIGQTPYRAVTIDLLRARTGARNLCGNQISGGLPAAPTPLPNLKPDCPADSTADTNAARVDLPQFETDQMRVTLTSVRPGQQATFGEADRDTLIVTIDEAVITHASEPQIATDQTLSPGSSIWIARDGQGQILKNESDQEMHVVIIAFEP